MKISLEEERLNCGMSVRGMAKKLKVAPNVIQRAEAGHSVSPVNAKKIADFYGYKVTDVWPLNSSKAAA